jgi:hypothetical protein
MKKLVLALVGIQLLLLSGVAEASISKELTYSESIVWRCAVRFIRVDKGFRILEKDKDTGYVLFEFTDSGRTTNGALEVLKVVRNDREYVRVQLNLQGQPKYVESLLFNKLERKLKNEYGIAPSAKQITPDAPTESEKSGTSETGSSNVDDDTTEEDLQVTEDDLNDNPDE